MLISEVYNHYRILPNLRHHMLQVTAVGVWITQHFQDLSIVNPEIIQTTLLLHDMGNILKFDLDAGRKLIGKEAERVEYWKQIQSDYKDKYGPDEHEATSAIAEELHVSNQVLRMLRKMGSSQTEQNVMDNDFNAKICTYSDMRIAPNGLVTVDERFDDGIKRYQDKPGFSFEAAEKSRKQCYQLENQIQEQLSLPITSLSQKDVDNLLVPLEEVNLS